MPPRTRLSGGVADVGEGTAVGGANGVAVGPGVDAGVGGRVDVVVAVGTGGTGVDVELLLDHWARISSVISKIPGSSILPVYFCAGTSDRIVNFDLFSKLQCSAACVSLMIVQG